MQERAQHHEIRFGNACDDFDTPESTTALDTTGMSLYLDCIHGFALTECGITLPKPTEQGWQEFYEKYKNFITH